MPEIVTCPVCGCKVQMPEGMLGRRVRCFGCDQRFVATPESAQPPRPEPLARPRPSAATPPASREEPVSPETAFCPACSRAVPWKAHFCPHCGEEFDDVDGVRGRIPPRFRRDALPHRGRWLTTLANISLAAGALSLCLFGAGALIGIPLGAAVWVMAQTDLAQMRDGSMDAQGRQLTETARAAALTGLILSLVFAAGYALWLLVPWM